MDSTNQTSAEYNPSIGSNEVRRSPFSENLVQLTQEEHVQLKWEAHYWKAQHEQLKKKFDTLQQKLESATARIRDLKQRLFGKKSEKGTAKSDSITTPSDQKPARPRGQQEGSKGHGRTTRPDLPIMSF